MERIIELYWGDESKGDAIVEFTTYLGDEGAVHEVINVFLPENIHPSQYAELKKQAVEAFHYGEGYNL